MKKHICIHGHFYQPPRENPWLEKIEYQESARPYHDWNERITAECYAANAASRILGQDDVIVDIVNNYAKISFNFGPTLLSWMEHHQPEVYREILDADQESRRRFSGHGSALAQVYNHMIMPLANARDKQTQVIWGIKDFEYRFRRKPEGMWLAETAVDTATLEVLAGQGITFTILAPHQARRTRRVGQKEWTDVSEGGVDPQRAYLCRLPSGRAIHVFFYDGPVSQEVAFSGLLKDGKRFADRLAGLFPPEDSEPRLAHIATDGETYGHHHRYGDMALAYCLYHIETNGLAKLTVYGQFLAEHPVTHEVEIRQNTSWSCAHGIERWRSDCGCSTGGRQDWHQRWRAPLREAMDWLRDRLAEVYERQWKTFGGDPWAIRDAYIDVILDRSTDNVNAFFRRHWPDGLTSSARVCLLKLLEMQRHALLMYTSCGWFFDEISGIETTQIIQYAARAIQLAQEVAGVALEDDFVRLLAKAPSNIPSIGNGAGVYERYVKTSKIDLMRVGAHYAVASLFEHYPDQVDVYCYGVQNRKREVLESGRQKIMFGQARVRSVVTEEEDDISFCVFHFGDHNFNGGVRCRMSSEAFTRMEQDIKEVFLKGDIPGVLQRMNAHFGMHNYSLWHMFKYEQKKVFDRIFRAGLNEIEGHYRRVYKEHYPSMLARKSLGIALPKVLATTLEFVLSRDLFDLLRADEIDIHRLEQTVAEVRRWAFPLEREALSYVAGQRVRRFMEALWENSEDLLLMEKIDRFLELVRAMDLDVDLGAAQNIFFKIGKRDYDKHRRKGTDKNQAWIDLFNRLGHFLRVRFGDGT